MSDTPPQRPHTESWVPALCLVLAVAAVVIVYFSLSKETALERLTIVVGYVIVILIFFFGLMVLIGMATNKIDLSGLLCDPGANKASMARFQLLIFTFVIAFSLFLIIVSGKELKFPEVPTGILMLLGISASTYAVSKGIQASQDQASDTAQAAARAAGQAAGAAAGQTAGQAAGQVAGQAAGHVAGQAAAQAVVGAMPPPGQGHE